MDQRSEYTCETASADETKQLAAALAPHVRAGHVLMLTGDLGAGKTQFAQGLAAALGIAASVVSPTFNIVISYEGGGIPLHHFDLYRLDAAEDLEDIGFYEYMEGDGVSLVEWGDKFPEALPEERLELVFRADGTGVRHIAARAFGREHGLLLNAWVHDANCPIPWQGVLRIDETSREREEA